MARPYPRHWNDRVIWLLEHGAGLPAGSDGLDLTQGSPSSGVLHRLRVTASGLDTAAEVTLQLPATTRAWCLEATNFIVTSGAATQYAFGLGSVAAYVANSIDQRVAYSASPVATAIREVYCKPIPVWADTDYRVYLRPGFNAGADNAIDCEFWFREVIGTVESTP
ncbi:MAG: hypothetical protein KGS10_05465 [Chloroflexi bacterium]|nr:hypothetical protein [Chloroflexota bacterium]